MDKRLTRRGVSHAAYRSLLGLFPCFHVGWRNSILYFWHALTAHVAIYVLVSRRKWFLFSRSLYLRLPYCKEEHFQILFSMATVYVVIACGRKQPLALLTLQQATAKQVYLIVESSLGQQFISDFTNVLRLALLHCVPGYVNQYDHPND